MNKSIGKTSNGICCFKVAFKELEKNYSVECWMLNDPNERKLEKMSTILKFCKSSIYLKKPYNQFEWFPNFLHVKF